MDGLIVYSQTREKRLKSAVLKIMYCESDSGQQCFEIEYEWMVIHPIVQVLNLLPTVAQLERESNVSGASPLHYYSELNRMCFGSFTGPISQSAMTMG